MAEAAGLAPTTPMGRQGSGLFGSYTAHASISLVLFIQNYQNDLL
jgi:hypothetical protein